MTTPPDTATRATAPGPPLTLHPDRLLPTDPGVRALARELYAAVRDLPIISPHGHVDAQLSPTTAPSRTRPGCSSPPDHYVTRLLHSQRRPAGRPRRRPGDRSPRRGPARPGGCSARTGTSSAARRSAVVRAELFEIFDVRERPTREPRPTRSTTHIAERLAEPSFRPRALLDAFGIEVLATTDDPCRRPRRHTAAARRPDVGTAASSRPSAPTATWSPARPTGRPHERGSARPAPTRHRRRTPASSPRWRPAARSSSSTAPSRPTTATATLRHRRRSRAGEAARIFAPALAGTATSAEADAPSAGTCSSRWRRMSCDDGLAMTLHPAVCAQPPPPDLRARTGRTSAPTSPSPSSPPSALRAAARRFGTRADFTLVALHHRRDGLARESSPRWPASTRRVYIGAPWWFLDAPDAIRPLPQRPSRRPPGFYPALRLHRRHARVPLHPGAARHVPAARLRPSSPSSSSSTASTRTRPPRSLHTLVADQPEDGVRPVSRRPGRTVACRGPPGTDGQRPPCASCTSDSGNFFRAHQAWYTEHAEDARSGASRPSPGALPDRPRPRDAGRALHPARPRPPTATTAEVVLDALRSRTPRGTTWRPGAPLADPAGRRRHAHRHRGRLPARRSGGLDRATRPWPRTSPGLRADPVAAAVTTAPASFVAGLIARRPAAAGPLTLLPCDNLPDNGAALARVVLDLAADLDGDLADWIRDTVAARPPWSTGSPPRPRPQTSTPSPTDPASSIPAWSSPSPSPSGSSPAPSRRATAVGVRRSPLRRGRGPVRDPQAVAAQRLPLPPGVCRAAARLRDGRRRDRRPAHPRLGRDWWDVAARHLPLPAAEVTHTARPCWTGWQPAIRHLLAQIAADGSQKLPSASCPSCAPSSTRAACPPPPRPCSEPGSSTSAAAPPRCATPRPTGSRSSRTAPSTVPSPPCSAGSTARCPTTRRSSPPSARPRPASLEPTDRPPDPT